MKLLSRSNIKLRKSEKYNYITYGLSLAPYNISGFNTCPHSTIGCRVGCIFTSGNGYFPAVQQARINRTKFWFDNPVAFKQQLRDELTLAVKLAERKGMKLCVRLNVFSDLPWERLFPEVFTEFSSVQFYDYTKNPRRMRKFLDKDFPSNYYLTFSWSETNESDVADVILSGGNVAVPFYLRKGDKLPKFYRLGVKEYRVIDGDKSDLRFRDKRNVVVGLRAKGKGRTDTTGFVVRI